MKKKQKQKSYLFITLSFVILTFLLIAPFHKALFNGAGRWNGFYSNSYGFETPIYGAIQWVSLLFIVISIFLFVKWKRNEAGDLFMWTIWLIPLSYIVSTFFAVQMYSHILSILIHVAYAAFFVAALWLAKQKEGVSGSALLLSGMIGTGYVLVIYGLFNLFGDATFGLFEYTSGGGASRIYPDAISIEGRGLRLTNVFQYANTYAAYLIALAICSLVLLVTVRRKSLVWLSALMLVPILLSLLLTQSRGGIVILPIIFVIILLFLTVRQQIMVCLQLVISTMAAIVILSTTNETALALHQNFSGSMFLKGWGIVMIASILSAVCALMLQKFVDPLVDQVTAKWCIRRWASVYLPVFFVLIASIGAYVLFGSSPIMQALPDSIEERISGISFQTHSVLERGTFYKNAMTMVKDYPIFGAGGGAWAALFETYQTNPYTSRQAHNFYLQHWIETGTVGLFILLSFIGAVIYFFSRSYVMKDEKERLPGLLFTVFVLSIFIHSIIDFNLSYVYMGALVFIGLGGMVANTSFTALPKKWIPFQKKSESDMNILRRAYPTALIVIALVVFITSSRFAQANNLYEQSLQNLQRQQAITQILAPLDQAIGVTAHPSYLNYKVSLLSQAYTQTKENEYFTAAEQLLQGLFEKDPYNKITFFQAYNLYAQTRQLERALDVIEMGLERFPWEMSFYERAIILHYQLSVDVPNEKDVHRDKILSLHDHILVKQAHLESLPEAQLQGNAFDISKDMALVLGEIYVEQAEYEKAVAVIKPVLDQELKSPIDLQLAKFYLASLIQLNEQDEKLYEKVKQSHPDLISQIDALTKN